MSLDLFPVAADPHGLFPQNVPLCERCRNIGYWVDDRTNTTHTCECGVSTRAALIAMLPREWWSASFATMRLNCYDAKTAAAIKAFAGKRGRWKTSVFLWGPVGSGKSHLAVSLLKLWAFTPENRRKARKAMWARFPEIVRGTFEEQQQALEDCINAEFLVLDEIGTSTGSEWIGGHLLEIIHRRNEEQKFGVYTSNLSTGQISSAYADHGQRIASRLEAMTIQEIDAKDQRRKAKVNASAKS